MSTINSSSAVTSPADRMQLALQAAVKTGTVKAADESALSTALTHIDTSLQSATPPAPGTDPASIKGKVSSLIDDQVSNGTLTDDQGSELKQVFAKAGHKTGGGHHHHVHAGGSDPSSTTNPIDSLFTDLTNAVDSILGTSSTTAATATASSSIDSSSAVTGATAAGSTASGSSATSADTLKASIDQLVGFLKQMEQQATVNYTAAGTTTNSLTANPMLVDASA